LNLLLCYFYNVHSGNDLRSFNFTDIMEQFTLTEDIRVYYIQAVSFPEGVVAAHEKLHAMYPFDTARRCFGVSRPEHGKIDYKAAAEELVPGEYAKHGLPSLIIRKGTYQCIAIKDFRKNIPAISYAFTDLIVQKGIDPQTYCVEWYQGMNDVLCMVRMMD